MAKIKLSLSGYDIKIARTTTRVNPANPYFFQDKANIFEWYYRFFRILHKNKLKSFLGHT